MYNIRIVTHLMKKTCILLLLTFIIYDCPTVCAAVDRQAECDSLVSKALDCTRHGKFSESNSIFQTILDSFRMSAPSKRSIYGCMGENARLNGDYADYYRYLKRQDTGRKSSSIRQFYKTLARLPEESVSRPEKDVTVGYSLDSLYYEGEFRGCELRVPGRISGKEEMFILDNGCAYFSMASESFAKEHHIRPIKAEMNAIGTVASAPSRIGLADSLVIGSMTFKNILFIIIPDIYLQNPVTKLDAALGTNIFRLAGRMTFDNKEKTVTFQAHDEAPAPNLTISGDGRHLADVAVGGDTLEFQLDLGASKTSLSSRYYALHKDSLHETGINDTIYKGGIGGMAEAQIYRIENVAISASGGTYISPEVLVFTEKGSGEGDEYGTLGLDFLLSFGSAELDIRKMYLKVEP